MAVHLKAAAEAFRLTLRLAWVVSVQARVLGWTLAYKAVSGGYRRSLDDLTRAYEACPEL